MALAILFAAAATRPVFAQPTAEELPRRIQQAIQDGVEFIKGKQNANGSWAEMAGQPCGVSALCTLALLYAGVPPDDPVVQKALTYLRSYSAEEIDATYSVALQTMVFCRASPERDRAAILDNVRWFEKTQVKEPPLAGGWSYPGLVPDNSNSQFALLALYEAERAGVPVSAETWQRAEKYWERMQNSDGSWGYRAGQPGTGSMTCAGLASLIIARKMALPPGARVEGDRIDCCRPAEAEDDAVRRGLAWLAQHYSVAVNPGVGEEWLLYYLYALERVGRLSALRFIGEHDWYREGSAQLLKLKTGRIGDAGGASLSEGWVGPSRTVEQDSRIATSLALLFLAKGRRPILIAKMKFAAAPTWNRHPADLTNLTAFCESRWKMDLSWQTVDFQAATVEDLRQSPVLHFCGYDFPPADDPQSLEILARKLRAYVDRGGFVVGEPACPGGTFDRGFRKLLETAFPEPEYRLKLLPPEHPIWRAEAPVPPKYLRPMLGIEFGCRTSVVYLPDDSGRPALSCLWELAGVGRENYAPEVQAQIDAALGIGVNILAYATDRKLEYKYAFFQSPSRTTQQGEIRRNALAVASLRHPGGCTVAPRALSNLLEYAEKELHLRVRAVEDELDITDPALFDHHLAFMHGRNGFRLTEAERKQLRMFVERGGTILGDAVCANQAFASSFAQEMSAIFPEHPLEPIPPDDPLFSPAFGGFDLRQVTRRDPQPGRSDESVNVLERKVPPELLGIRIGDRWGVIFSPYDLSCALEKQNSVECRGYTTDDAARLGLNCILYAMQK
ncbi:DUF4159 domain-containing protein [Thermostilla marina]